MEEINNTSGQQPRCIAYAITKPTHNISTLLLLNRLWKLSQGRTSWQSSSDGERGINKECCEKHFIINYTCFLRCHAGCFLFFFLSFFILLFAKHSCTGAPDVCCHRVRCAFALDRGMPCSRQATRENAKCCIHCYAFTSAGAVHWQRSVLSRTANSTHNFAEQCYFRAKYGDPDNVFVHSAAACVRDCIFVSLFSLLLDENAIPVCCCSCVRHLGIHAFSLDIAI